MKLYHSVCETIFFFFAVFNSSICIKYVSDIKLANNLEKPFFFDLKPCMDGGSLFSYLVFRYGRLVTGEASVGVKAMQAGKITARCRFLDTMTA